MLKTSGIVKLTLRENLRGQLLWSSSIAGSILLLLIAVISGIALSHEARVIDVFSYFAADQILLFVAILSGSSICSTDYSSRGLAELYIPAGTPRHSLYIARLFAFAVVLFALAVAMFGLKIFILPQLADHPKAVNYQVQFTMLFFAWLKSLTALSISGFLGSLVRPIYAVLAAFTLYSVGHLTSSFDSLLSSTSALSSEQSTSSSFLYLLFKIWNPNLLVVDSIRGEWISPTWGGWGQGLTWCIACLLIPTALTLVRLNRIDIRP